MGKQAKQAAKSEARAAASTGSFSRSNAQALRSAGVSSNAVQSIRSDSRQNRPVATGTISYSSNDPNSYVQTSTPTAAGLANSRQQGIRNANSLGQAVKIAASNDGLIGGKEMKKLLSGFGDNILKIRSKVDDLNNRLGSQNGDIGYKANAWNKMNTGQYDSRDVARQRLYGGMLDRTLGTTGDFASPLDKGFQKLRKGWSAFDVPGADTQFRNSRDLTAGPGGWGQYSSLYNTPTDPMTDAGGATGATGATGNPDAGATGMTDPGLDSSQTLPDTQPSPNSTVFGDGADVMSGIGGWRPNRKQSRKLAGYLAQGYKSNLISPKWGKYLGINAQ